MDKANKKGASEKSGRTIYCGPCRHYRNENEGVQARNREGRFIAGESNIFFGVMKF